MPEIEVAELAAWLSTQGRDVLWAIDGEEHLAGELSLPCTGEDLAAALVTHDGRIHVDLPEAVALPPGGLTRANFDTAAERDDDARVFRLAWVKEGGVGDSWLLVEDTLAKQASA